MSHAVVANFLSSTLCNIRCRPRHDANIEARLRANLDDRLDDRRVEPGRVVGEADDAAAAREVPPRRSAGPSAVDFGLAARDLVAAEGFHVLADDMLILLMEH